MEKSYQERIQDVIKEHELGIVTDEELIRKTICFMIWEKERPLDASEIVERIKDFPQELQDGIKKQLFIGEPQ